MADVTHLGKRSGRRCSKSVKDPHEAKSDAASIIKSLRLSDKQLLHTYQQMGLEIRHFEELMQPRFSAPGKPRLPSAAIFICISAMRPNHSECSTLAKRATRCSPPIATTPTALWCGSDPGKVLAEIAGKSTGVSRGKGGSMHLFDKEHGFAGGYGIVGGNIPLSIGIGWALKYKKDRQHLRVLHWRRRYELRLLP